MSSFIWTADGHDLPIVEAHTKARHRVTEDYVQDWVVTLCANNMGKHKKITLIDGFCGGGMYQDEEGEGNWEGSPLRLVRSVERGLAVVKNERGKPDYTLDAKFVFIDHKQEHIDCLKKQFLEVGLDEYVFNPSQCEFICSDFEDVLDSLLEDLRERKGSSLFILDPTGYSDVSMLSIRKIIELRTSEILYTFMIEYVKRFFTLKDSSLKDVYEKKLEITNFFQELTSDSDFESRGKNGYIRNETLRLFRSRGLAPYAYSFALLPGSDTVRYYLIHMATSPAAQRVIKVSLWSHNNLDLAYQHRYATHGLGFRSSNYYERNLSLINIDDANKMACIQNLADDLMPLLDFHEDGITFQDLHEGTMQKNPATINHYSECLNLQRSYGEVEILRKGRPTSAQKIKSDDVIVRPKQGKLFNMRRFMKT
jgi:three-Cys-motif partner protein